MPDMSRIPSARRGGALALALIAAVHVSGCGRRGELEPPPSADAVQPAAQPVDPLHPQIRKPVAPITPPKQPFLLDPLL